MCVLPVCHTEMLLSFHVKKHNAYRKLLPSVHPFVCPYVCLSEILSDDKKKERLNVICNQKMN